MADQSETIRRPPGTPVHPSRRREKICWNAEHGMVARMNALAGGIIDNRSTLLGELLLLGLEAKYGSLWRDLADSYIAAYGPHGLIEEDERNTRHQRLAQRMRHERQQNEALAAALKGKKRQYATKA